MVLLQIYYKSKKSVVSSSFTFHILSVIFTFSFVTLVMYDMKGRTVSTVLAFQYSFKLMVQNCIIDVFTQKIIAILSPFLNTYESVCTVVLISP